MGNPMTPRPRKATFAIGSSYRRTANQARRCLYAGVIATGAARPSTVITLTGPSRRLWCRASTDDGQQTMDGPCRCRSMLGRPIRLPGGESHAMTVTKEQVLASLEGVKSPDGMPLPRTGKLSEVVAGDGKVFFSISVDAGEVKAWEGVRKRAEEAVRALPGVQSALVALTAERKGGAAPARSPQGTRAPPARGTARGESIQGV